MGILKIDPYLRNIYLWSENKLNFDPIWGRQRVCVQLLELLPGVQVSYPNMVILKIALYLGNHCPYSENKLNLDPLGQEESIRATYVHLLLKMLVCLSKILSFSILERIKDATIKSIANLICIKH